MDSGQNSPSNGIEPRKSTRVSNRVEGKRGGKNANGRGRLLAPESKSTPEINVEPPTQGIQGDRRGRNRDRIDEDDPTKLGPGPSKPRSNSSTVHVRILASFRHILPSDSPSPPPSNTRPRSWSSSYGRLPDGVRTIDSSEVKRKSTPVSGKDSSSSNSMGRADNSQDGTKKPDSGRNAGPKKGGKARNGNDEVKKAPGGGVRRSHSQESLSKPSSNAGSKPKRSSSISPTRKKNQRPPLFDVQDDGSNRRLQRLADNWFNNLEKYTEKLIANYETSQEKRVRIAILDTGLEKSTRRSTPEAIKDRGHQIKGGKSFVKAENTTWSKDSNGHGTHITGLVLRVAPRADIYIARVVRGFEKTINPDNVVNALQCCIDEWNVDIITMSFGYDKEHPGIEDQLKRAYDKDILIFAAASNDGASKPINVAWPARAPSVMCIYSANGEGGNSGFNPPPKLGRNFAFLGQEVNSAWPIPLLSEKEQENDVSSKRKSGTSFAAPIAAAVAALILEFARQPPLDKAPLTIVAQQLKKMSRMEEVFELMSERKDGSFDYVYPWKIFNATAGKGTAPNDAEDRFSARGLVERELVSLVARQVDLFPNIS